jgi:hypothetical protein
MPITGIEYNDTIKDIIKQQWLKNNVEGLCMKNLKVFPENIREEHIDSLSPTAQQKETFKRFLAELVLERYWYQVRDIPNKQNMIDSWHYDLFQKYLPIREEQQKRVDQWNAPDIQSQSSMTGNMDSMTLSFDNMQWVSQINLSSLDL